MTVRTRMAPSPTGEYHVGSLRTLLYNYALARKEGGKFVMRIEDTDQARLVEGATERLLEVIKDYGLDWDEFHVQSDRLEIYKEHVEKLISNDKAYYCFCTPEELKAMRDEQQSRGMASTKYDGTCRKLSLDDAKKRVESGEKYVIRLKVPKNEDVIFNDEILGEIKFNTDDIDDNVLMKSDGFPTYHLAVVIDDHLMNITHIMRGNEWLPSTPKHVLLYKAFGWELPKIAHLPNLKEKGANKKLSKRFGDVDARSFLEKGYLPEAMLNFLMFLGWNPGTEKEIYTLEEFISDFSIDRIHKTDLVAFDRDKLLWVNGYYIRNLPLEALLEKLMDWKDLYKVELPEGLLNTKEGQKIVGMVQDRLKVFNELPELVAYFYTDPVIDTKLLTKFAKENDRTKEILNNFIELYEGTFDWNIENLDKVSHDLLEKLEYKPKEAFMTIRVAVSGLTATPPLFDMLEVLGKELTINRLRNAHNKIDG